MSETFEPLQCRRSFLGAHHERNERRTWVIVALTAAMMVGEIAAGTVFGSMALVADGWHMATHAAALAIAALAYRYARRHARDERFAFGTGKVGELAGFASAIVLGVVALLIGFESLQRLLQPRSIGFDQALAVAVLGLVVNLVSAYFLRDDHEHDHQHDDQHDHAAGGAHGAHHHDTNLRAAYVHVLADALTSVLAIAGLLAGRFLGWTWMDPVIGIVGAVVIAHWSLKLIRQSGHQLLDARDDDSLARSVRSRLESAGAAANERVTDLHVWRLGPGHDAVLVSLVSDVPAAPSVYKSRLAGLASLSHVTIEVNARRTVVEPHAPRSDAQA